MRTHKSATRGGGHQGWRSREPGRGVNSEGWRSREPGHGVNLEGSLLTRDDNTIPEDSCPPLGALIQTLSEADLSAADQPQRSSGQAAEINGCAYVASFNWLDRDQPTILIPGAPPAWTPLDEPRKLEQDKGDYFRDPNAAHFPIHPLEPAVRSLLTEHEDLKTQEINLVACSSTVGSLLRFVRHVDKTFRFFVEAVGNTVFFTRHENSPAQLIVGVKGHGHTFPEAYTTWDPDVKGSTSHQRLLRYNFAGLDCILRFDCDGYLRSKVPGGISTSATAHGQKTTEEESDLASIWDRIKVSPAMAGGAKDERPLHIEKSGGKVPQEAIFDLKTRSAWKKDLNVIEEELPRFWLAQIPNFILARHYNGLFDDIKVQHIRDDVQEWQRDNQKYLKRLAWLLREIIAVAKARKDGKLEVCCTGPDALELREQDTDEHNVLPTELKLRWMEDEPSKAKQPESDDSLTKSEILQTARSDMSDDSGRFGDFDEESEESGQDYTACCDRCGYCGNCSY